MLKLYDYQLDAVHRMKNGCILQGKVGSGKSITAISYYYLEQGGDESSLCGEEYIPMNDPPKDLYIITTARKRDTFEWEKELSPFLLSSNPEVNLYSNKVVIDSWNNIKKYKDVKDSFFIFDEQKLVGSGVWVKSFLTIRKSNKWILLSATPGDTWSDYIPVFIANGFYKNRTAFLREHAVFSRVTKYPKIERYIGTGKLARLRRSILVPMNYERDISYNRRTIRVEYSREKFKTARKDRWNVFEQRPIKNASELCYVVRKIVNTDITRQNALLELIHAHPKSIVFYNFDYELDILRSLDYGKATVAEWNGHKHELIPESPRWVYLVQYSAGAEGWNCTQTDTIIFYSANYSYKIHKQAEGRIDRVNTKFKVLNYYRLMSYSDIDIAIDRALKSKRDFNESSYAKW